jgi:hypothetical protein
VKPPRTSGAGRPAVSDRGGEHVTPDGAPVLALDVELLAWSHRYAERARAELRCKVCDGSSPRFDVVDFHKCCDPRLYPFGLSGVPVFYYRCHTCRFIFTDFFDGFTPAQWSRHVYNADYVKVDPEYVDARPRSNALELRGFLRDPSATIGLDFGGGNGLTASLMRDAGWSFDSFDPYGHSDISQARLGRYNFCSAMEVFEHTPDPAEALRSIVEMCTRERLVVFVGTGVHDGIVTDQTRLSWWYAGPRNGHISLFSREALRRLGLRFGLDYASVTRGTHLLTRGVSLAAARAQIVRGKLRRQFARS